tara:strand:+ start:173 stop:478 length:306 start_codon:yes stop_codon:yes gene_type:complete
METMTKLNLKNPCVIERLDSTKEELLAKLLIAEAQLNVQKMEGKWLDTLANEMRDCANRDYHEDWMDEMNEDTEIAYKEFKEEHKKQNKKLAELFETETLI